MYYRQKNKKTEENPNIKFKDGNYIYHGQDTVTALATMFVFGAWYAFQEQQKKIDDAFLENAKLKHVIDQVKLHNGSLGFRSMQRMIEELLK